MNHTEAVEQMLQNLDTWRHLPKYQLERRADMFFGLFVRQIVSEYSGDPIHPIIIPEFPFKHKKTTNHTVNFDYVLFSEKGTCVYILELKTDANSVDHDQLENLKDASQVQFAELLEGIRDVQKNTKQDKKYACLFDLLEKVKIESPKIELLYLSPRLDDAKRDVVLKVVKKEESEHDNIIDFQMAAEILEKTGGAVECHFAAYLRRWNDVKAGSISND